MLKKTAVLALLLCWLLPKLHAQENYTFKTDRAFKHIHEVEGYSFRPSVYQTDKNPLGVAPGEVEIMIKGDSLLIAGLPNVGNYHIKSRFRINNNFIYELLQGPAATKHSRFRIINNAYGQTIMLYLFDKDSGPHVFTLADDTAENQKAKLEKYSSQRDHFVRSYINLIGKAFMAFQGNDYQDLEEPTEVYFDKRYIEWTEGEKSNKYKVRKATTYEYISEDFPAVRSIIKVKLKKQKQRLLVYVNYRHEVECIELDGKRLFLTNIK